MPQLRYAWEPRLSAGIVEYKNPFSMRDMTLSEACSKATFCLKVLKEGSQITYQLKRQRDYSIRYSANCIAAD